MFVDFCYYFVSSGLVASVFFSTYYYYDEIGAKKLIINASWKTTIAYFHTRSYINNIIYGNCVSNTITAPDCIDKVEKKPQKTFVSHIMFDPKKNTYCQFDDSDSLLDSVLIDDIKSSLVFIHEIKNEKHKFKRFCVEDQSDLEFVQVEKQFIQMELIVGDIELDIHPYLKDYYYEKNQILDKTFLLWLCNYNSLEEVPLKEIREGNYTIKIIDKNVEMFDLKSTESIFLIGDSGYQIVPNCTK
jgi:hypothetical protein